MQELDTLWNDTGEERENYFFTFDKDSLKAGLRFINTAIRCPFTRKKACRKNILLWMANFNGWKVKDTLFTLKVAAIAEYDF